MVDYDYIRYDMSMHKTKNATRYAIRNKKTKERLTYRHADYHELVDMLKYPPYNTGEYEIYRTSQRLVTMKGN